MSADATTVRNDHLSLLLDMNETAKGRELVRAFVDHAHASGDISVREVVEIAEIGMLPRAAFAACSSRHQPQLEEEEEDPRTKGVR